MRSAKDFFKPKAIGAPDPPREIPFEPARMIHFFDPSNPKMAAKLPELATKCDVLLGNLEDAIQADRKIEAAVLTGFGIKAFVSGADIRELAALQAPEEGIALASRGQRVLNAIENLGKPVVAAIIGHAIAGGCILALCCDYRFIAEGKKLMGLNEIKLGVPVPYPADRILQNLIGWRMARDVIDGGEFYGGQELFEKGMVDQVLPMEDVLPRAIEKAETLSASSPEAFALIKRNRTEPVKTEILAELDERERRFVERWYSPEARERLDEAIEKF